MNRSRKCQFQNQMRSKEKCKESTHLSIFSKTTSTRSRNVSRRLRDSIRTDSRLTFFDSKAEDEITIDILEMLKQLREDNTRLFLLFFLFSTRLQIEKIFSLLIARSHSVFSQALYFFTKSCDVKRWLRSSNKRVISDFKWFEI